jgi:Rrf2 family protein
MIKLSKKVEYALMALRSIKGSGENIVTAKEISEGHNIPYDLLAKILQKLKKENILISTQGINGGYKLNTDLNIISLSNLMDMLEDNKAIVECQQMKTDIDCIMLDDCTMKNPMEKMQKELESLLKSKMVSEFL